MADNRAKLEAFNPVLSRPFRGVKDLLAPAVLSALAHLRPWASLDVELQRYFRDPRLRLAFSFQSKYLGMSPYRCPSLFSILSFLEHEHGVWHPIGGCNSVMEVMARLARRMGVRFELDTAVHEIVFDGRKATGVRTDAGVQQADAVVVNADFSHAIQKLVPNALRSRWSDKQLAKKQYSCSTFMLYLGIEGAVDLQHHTVLLAEDYATNLREIEDGKTPPAAPSAYVQNASLTDPTLAPAGHSALYVLVPVGNLQGGIDWAALRGALPRAGAAAAGKRSASGTWSRASAARRSSRPRTGSETTRSSAAPPSTWRTTSGRCCAGGRRTGSRSSTASTSSAAERTPAAACR